MHYCVANIPGAVARTSTLALTSATLPYLVRVARHGVAGVRPRPTRPWPGPEHPRRQPGHPTGGRGARPALTDPADLLDAR